MGTRARRAARCASMQRGGEPTGGNQARPGRWAGAWELSGLDTGGSGCRPEAKSDSGATCVGEARTREAKQRGS
jgi:hypothetical protein